MRKLLIIQIILIALVVVGFHLQQGQAVALSALFGGSIALVNTLLLAWGVRRAGQTAEKNGTRGALTLYLGAIERFVFTLVGFLVGMGTLKLSPVPMLTSFAVAQLGYWFGARDNGRMQRQ
jgi:ATP synthase protein I